MSAKLGNIYASTPVVTRGQPFHLGGDPKGKNFLYCCGNSVVIRNIEDPLICDMYNEHSTTTTVAKYSPSGFYIASGDSNGIVRIWDTTQLEHPLKFEMRALSGAVMDIAWSGDSQRIVAVGDGREEFGVAFFWDSGASVGTVTGHGKTVHSCDVKQNRPFRLITGGLDQQVCHSEGPPFKFKKSQKDHTRFVNCVRFSPDGVYYITVGSDMKGFIYDGKTGDKIGELNAADAHKGGIYSVSWSPDSKQVLTVSADKTAKIWAIPEGNCLTTFQLGGDKPPVEFQQYSSLWQGDNLLTVSLAGDITYLDPENPNKPKRVIRGHNKFVNALAYDKSGNALYSAGYDGIIRGWDVGKGDQEVPLTGKGHTNMIAGLVVDSEKNLLLSVGLDDTFRMTDIAKKEYGAESVSLEAQPSGIAAANAGLVIVTTLGGVVVIRNGQWAFTLPTPYKPKCAAVSPDQVEVAIGGDDQKIHILSLENDVLSEKKVLEKHRGEITTLNYSPNGEMLASADSNREVVVWTRDGAIKIEGLVFHNARVTSVGWSPDSTHFVTAGLDQQIIIWNVSSPSSRISIKNAHQGGVNAVLFIDNNTIASGGQDCAVKTWDIAY